MQIERTCAVFGILCLFSLCSTVRLNRKEHSKAHIVRTESWHRENTTFCSPAIGARSTRRIAFYGGAFDPITVAHVAVAKAALVQPLVDCVWMSPIYHPKYKPCKKDAVLRERMISMSFNEEDAEKIKVTRAYQKSYTDGMDIQRMDFQAYEWLETNYPKTNIDMVVGADSLAEDGPYTVEGWRDILRAVAKKSNRILVLSRDNEGVEEYEKMLLEKWDVSPSPFVHVDVNMSAFSKVSSSRIRKLLQEDAKDGKIDEGLRQKLIEAGLSEPLLDFLQSNPDVVSSYRFCGTPSKKSVKSGGMRTNIFMASYVVVFTLQQLLS